MHLVFLNLQSNIVSKGGHIRQIKVYIEQYAGRVWAHQMTQAHKLVCMQAIFVHAPANTSAKIDKVAEIAVFF